MANAQTTHGAPAIDAAVEKVTELNEQVLAAARKAGNLYVDSVETAVGRTIELELKVADTTEQDWLKELLKAQAGFAREISASYTTTARSLLK